MSTVFTNAPAAGNPLPRADYQGFIDLAENSLADLGPFLISGLTPSAGAGLSVNVSSGVASIGGRLTVAATFAISVSASSTNHLFLLNTGAGVSNTSGTQPAGSAKLGTATTDGAGVTAVAVTWASGRQLLVRHENLVHGSGAGHPRAIDLASWHATNNEGNEVKGSLPAGTLPSSAMLKDSDQTVSDGWDLSVGSTNGTKIATATTQKLGFFNTTPIVQPANTVEITTVLSSLGLRATGGSPELNLNGGLLNVGTAAFAGTIGGSGVTAFSLKRFALTFPSDADYTLLTGEADAIVIDVQAGVITAARNIVVPGTSSALYIVINRNAQSVVLKTAAGTGITVATTRARVIYFPTGVNGFSITGSNDYTA